MVESSTRLAALDIPPIGRGGGLPDGLGGLQRGIDFGVSGLIALHAAQCCAIAPYGTAVSYFNLSLRATGIGAADTAHDP